MKQLIVFKFPEETYNEDIAKRFDEFVQKNIAINYEVIVMWGDCDIKVYNIPFFIKLYTKIKSWLILKIWKKRTS